jgi:hypothetical protein
VREAIRRFDSVSHLRCVEGLEIQVERDLSWFTDLHADLPGSRSERRRSDKYIVEAGWQIRGEGAIVLGPTMRSACIPILLLSPAVLPAGSQWINIIAPDSGVLNESFTAPVSVSPDVMTGAITATMSSRNFCIRAIPLPDSSPTEDMCDIGK